MSIWVHTEDRPVDRNTFDSTMRTFKHRTPFRPFTVSLVNGDRLEVDHSDALVVRDGVGLFGDESLVGLLQQRFFNPMQQVWFCYPQTILGCQYRGGKYHLR